MPAALDNAQGANGDVIEFAPQRIWTSRKTLANALRSTRAAPSLLITAICKPPPAIRLQAVQAHEYVAVTDRPGESDITSHVDFEALAKAFSQGGAAVPLAITQRAFLLAMGLEQRAAILSSKADANSRDDPGPGRCKAGRRNGNGESLQSHGSNIGRPSNALSLRDTMIVTR